jgi:hypothetical protein
MSGPEKTKFTELRKSLMDSWPDSRELEERWGHYSFIPLDVPRIGNALMAEWLTQHFKPIYQVINTISSPADTPNSTAKFNAVNIRMDKDNMTSIHDFYSTNIRNTFLEEFPYFHEELMDTLPFNAITSWDFLQSNKLIGSHRDQHQDFRDFPGSFRSMIYDDNPMSTLFLKEILPDSNKEIPGTNKRLPRIPETNTFVWNNLRTQHGSFHFKNHNKILLVINNKNINIKKYNNLIERSISKYSEYIKISKYQTSDYVNL